MVMTRFFAGFTLVSIVFSLFTGNGGALGASVLRGAQRGVELTVAMAGAICLWSGIRRILEEVRVLAWLSRALSPLLHRLFPAAKADPALAGDLSGNFCANLLGLGNAATPMGISAARRLAAQGAGDQLCRLVVLNTASLQLLPTTVAAVRASLGCASPFDILPMVWVTSLASAAVGLAAAWVLGKA